MNRQELCNAIAAHTRTEAKHVDTFLKGFSDVVIAAVSKGEAVLVSGFAKFDRVQTKARNGRNPATGQAMRIPAAKKAHITPLKGFQDVVCGNIPAPRLSKSTSSFKSGTSTSSSRSNTSKSSPRSNASTSSSRSNASKSSSRPGTSKTMSRPMVKTMSMKNSTKNSTKKKSPAKALAKR